MQQPSRRMLGFILLFTAIFLGMLFVMPSVQAQSAPSTTQTINFTARLKAANGAIAPDGYYNVSFRLYDQNESGAPIWSEVHYDENGPASGGDYRIKVTNGNLSAKLGSRTAFGSNVNWDGNLWLTMNIGGTKQTSSVAAIPWDGEMSPRIELNAVPYAMNAGLLGGKAAGDFIQLGQGMQTNSSNNPSIQINSTGSGDLVKLQHSAKDVFTIDTTGNIAFGPDSDHTISIDQSAADSDGRSLTISGGAGGDGATNGGNVIISGGSGDDNGAAGLVMLATTAFSTSTDDANCYTDGAVVTSSCAITQTTVDTSSATIIGFSEANQTATLPNPTLATPGRILYVMAANDSKPFLLTMNENETIPLRAKTALTLLWNGSAWVVAGHNGLSNNNPINPTVAEEDIVTPPLVLDEGLPESIGIQEPNQTSDVPAEEAVSNAPFQLAPLDSAPMAAPGTMYYDSTLGKVQCLEEDGWGACSDAPDAFVTISPEYKNAVMNGTDIGVISSDFCSSSLGINDGSKQQPAVCGVNETYNFYRWTSEQNTDQTRSIYLTYQLPDNFKSFIPASTSVKGRSDSEDASVSYQVYRDNGTGLLSCGNAMTIANGPQPAWQQGLATNEIDPASCDFEAGDSILFRINLTAKNAANAYVSNVNFVFRNT